MEQNIISKITEPTDCVAAMVVAPKAGSNIWIYVDLSWLNRFIKREIHPIPHVKVALFNFTGAVFFSRLDVNSRFHQMVLEKESRKLTTFLMPFGWYYFNRLPFGISSVSENFQTCMSQILEGFPNIVCHTDDTFVFSPIKDEHDKTITVVFKRIQKAGMTLNQEKCCFRRTKIRFEKYLAWPKENTADQRNEPSYNKKGTSVELRFGLFFQLLEP